MLFHSENCIDIETKIATSTKRLKQRNSSSTCLILILQKRLKITLHEIDSTPLSQLIQNSQILFKPRHAVEIAPTRLANKPTRSGPNPKIQARALN